MNIELILRILESDAADTTAPIGTIAWNNKKDLVIARYSLNKSLPVGETMKCPSCGCNFIKTQHQQAFCRVSGSTKCKDKYWNEVTPEKKNNTTRISPANRAWKERFK